ILPSSASSLSMEKEHQQREPKEKYLSRVTKCSALRRQSTVTTPDLRRYQSLHYPLNCRLLI
uniref:Uncharacterized protein n=1 Tax=Cebus imitator TaxID=2715852 RepID=A0A2K5PZ79_CEBIM